MAVDAPGRRCLFCPNEADTKEHATPDWLLREVGQEQRGSVRLERRGHSPREWKDRPVEIRVACRVCNHGWMSRLEDEARPVVRALVAGNRADLTAAQQVTLATWAVKTAMVWESLRGDEMSFSEDERRHVRNSRVGEGLALPLPPRAFVWLAAYEGPAATNCAGYVLYGLQSRAGGERLLIGYATTITAGAFVAQVLNVSYPGEVNAFRTILEDEGKWPRFAIRIWPPRAPGRSLLARWPPEHWIAGDEGECGLVAFERRWSRSALGQPEPSP